MAKLLETLSGVASGGTGYLSWLCPLEKLECFPPSQGCSFTLPAPLGFIGLFASFFL